MSNKPRSRASSNLSTASASVEHQKIPTPDELRAKFNIPPPPYSVIQRLHHPPESSSESSPKDPQPRDEIEGHIRDALRDMPSQQILEFAAETFAAYCWYHANTQQHASSLNLHVKEQAECRQPLLASPKSDTKGSANDSFDADEQGLTSCGSHPRLKGEGTEKGNGEPQQVVPSDSPLEGLMGFKRMVVAAKNSEQEKVENSLSAQAIGESPSSLVDIAEPRPSKQTPTAIVIEAARTPPAKTVKAEREGAPRLNTEQLGSHDPLMNSMTSVGSNSEGLGCQSWMASAVFTPSAVRVKDACGFDTINQYAFVNEIGSGAHGVVYKGEEINLDTGEIAREVAIKVVKRQQIRSGFIASPMDTHSPITQATPREFQQKGTNSTCDDAGPPSTTPKDKGGGVDMFHEIAIMKQVKCENVVRLIEAIDDPRHQQIYLIMPFIENGPILKKDNAGNFISISEFVALKYLRQVAKGLSYLHANNIVHRDIKPDNILLGKDEKVFIADFGVSEIFDENQEFNMNMVRMGTPAFKPPELFSTQERRRSSLGTEDEGVREKPLDGRAADVWAVGITFYLMLMGDLPFPQLNRKSRTFFDEYMKLVQTQDIDVPDHVPQHECGIVSRELLRQMLNRDPQKRITAQRLYQHRGLRTNAFRHQLVISDMNLTSPGSESLTSPSMRPLFSPGGSTSTMMENSLSGTLMSPGGNNLLEELMLKVSDGDIESAMTAVRLPRNTSRFQLQGASRGNSRGNSHQVSRQATPPPQPEWTTTKSQ